MGEANVRSERNGQLEEARQAFEGGGLVGLRALRLLVNTAAAGSR
jgi:hypothetical protein